MRRTSLFLAILILLNGVLLAQGADPKAIDDRIRKLRSLDDRTRAKETMELARQIRTLTTLDQRILASSLANLTTEGDFGRDTLQYVTETLETAVRKYPPPVGKNGPDWSYFQLASLSKYEGMKVGLQHPQYSEALKKLQADDDARASANFTLKDLNGNSWTLRDLRGKVVLVNFWATWCPPCRKEMPDLDALHSRFKDKGLVILAISDEDAKTVQSFIATEQKVKYPILLDPGSKVTEHFRVNAIPKTFIYDRQGRLAAQSIDMRTMGQFLALLKQAGLE